MSNGQGRGQDDHQDATIVRPRNGLPGGPAPSAPLPPPLPGGNPSAAPTYVGAGPGVAAAPSPAPAVAIGEFAAGGTNLLARAASPLLMLAAQLRSTVSHPNPVQLREQVVAQIRQFESRAQAAGIMPQTVTAARYALCTTIDEAVLNTPWGERSGWAAKTQLMIFHGEAYGGEKFFQILDRLIQDPQRHLDLIELMYFCLVLGFGGRYLIEPGGLAKLADIQEDLYRRIKPLRPPPAEELAPHWKGLEDRRNPLIRYVPFWVIAAAGAVIVLIAFLWFFTRLNERSAPISAMVAQVGLESARPAPDEGTQAPPPAAPRKSLKQLLAPQEQAGQLTVDERPDGSATVRLSGSTMFASGGVTVSTAEISVLKKVAEALNQVEGRVVVVGHTDDQPVHSLRFKDNYELSAVRAKAVQAILAQTLSDPGRLDSSGAGPSQPIALPPGTPANRARNRRVDILFTPEG